MHIFCHRFCARLLSQPMTKQMQNYDKTRATLQPVIKQKIMPDSIVYTDSLSSYDKLDVSGFIHYRINHSKEFADRQNHINCRK